jgi:hypothetical protein
MTTGEQRAIWFAVQLGLIDELTEAHRARHSTPRGRRQDILGLLKIAGRPSRSITSSSASTQKSAVRLLAPDLEPFLVQ